MSTYSCSLRGASPLLPDVHVAGAHHAALIGVKTAGHHWQDAVHDPMEDDVRVVDRTDTDTSAGRALRHGLVAPLQTTHESGSMPREHSSHRCHFNTMRLIKFWWSTKESSPEKV